MSEKKIIIVGGGVAGISVAIHFIQAGKKVRIIDSGENHSSKVAAGQINPIVFRRLTKSWRIDEFFPYAKTFYQELEKESGLEIYEAIKIRRFFSSLQERGFWTSKQDDPEFLKYISPINDLDQDFPYAHNPFGSGLVHTAAVINAENFLSAGKNFVKKENEWLTDNFDFSQVDPDYSLYKNEEFEELIFCTGYRNMENPFFNHKFVQQTKGEVLTISADEIPDKEALNRKCFLLPLGNKEFKIGSNYRWDDASLHTTEDAKEEITENAKHLLTVPFKIIGQKAGVRPTTMDRRPIIDTHPDHPRIKIFNGLGAKGYLLAPLLAKEFTEGNYIYKA